MSVTHPTVGDVRYGETLLGARLWGSSRRK
jgi:hypothetical protein